MNLYFINETRRCTQDSNVVHKIFQNLMLYLRMYFNMHLYFINETRTCTQDSNFYQTF